MKIVRAQRNTESFFAILEGTKLYPLVGSPFEQIQRDGRVFELDQAKLLAPCVPSKIVAVGLNYLDHIKEMNDPMPEEPVIFLKPSTAVIGPEDKIIAPKRSKRVDFEAELAVVIRKKCRYVAIENVDEVIFGYTCLNDVTARDIQPIDGQWTRAKGFDTFAPIGPCIETEFDPEHAAIRSVLNGKVMQDSNTAMMMRSARELVVFASSVMTLLPGDVITLGTPQGIATMRDGDTIQICIEGIGTLTNYVESEK